MTNALRLSAIFFFATLFCLLMLAIAPAHAALHPAHIGFFRLHGAAWSSWRLSPRLSPGGLPGAGSMRASWYGGGERLDARTASGERFDAGALTAAHRTLPFGTRLTVCLGPGRSGRQRCVVVRVNDRGPAARTGRSLDLSRAAAARIGLVGPGVATVRVTRIGGWS